MSYIGEFDISSEYLNFPDVNAEMSIDIPPADIEIPQPIKKFVSKPGMKLTDINWKNKLMDRLANCDPLRSLIDNEISRDYLTYWELYSLVSVSISQKLACKITSNQTKANQRAKDYGTHPRSVTTDVIYRSFHIYDNKCDSTNSMKKIINQIESTNSLQIKWEWLATYTSIDNFAEIVKNKERWIKHFNDNDKITSADIRAWQNRINTTIKSVDLIVSGFSNPIGPIIFTILNLSKGGTSIIKLSDLENSSELCMIYLCMQCFEFTRIIHLHTDEIYLIGEGFSGTPRKSKNLLKWIDSNSECPFHQSVIDTTIPAFAKIFAEIAKWRHSRCEKIITCATTLEKSLSMRTFGDFTDAFIDDNFKDESDIWKIRTRYY